MRVTFYRVTNMTNGRWMDFWPRHKAQCRRAVKEVIQGFGKEAVKLERLTWNI